MWKTIPFRVNTPVMLLLCQLSKFKATKKKSIFGVGIISSPIVTFTFGELIIIITPYILVITCWSTYFFFLFKKIYNHDFRAINTYKYNAFDIIQKLVQSICKIILFSFIFNFYLFLK